MAFIVSNSRDYSKLHLLEHLLHVAQPKAIWSVVPGAIYVNDLKFVKSAKKTVLGWTQNEYEEHFKNELAILVNEYYKIYVSNPVRWKYTLWVHGARFEVPFNLFIAEVIRKLNSISRKQVLDLLNNLKVGMPNRTDNVKKLHKAIDAIPEMTVFAEMCKELEYDKRASAILKVLIKFYDHFGDVAPSHWFDVLDFTPQMNIFLVAGFCFDYRKMLPHVLKDFDWVVLEKVVGKYLPVGNSSIESIKNHKKSNLNLGLNPSEFKNIRELAKLIGNRDLAGLRVKIL